MADSKYLRRQEIIDYPGSKLPVVFCIDVSGSMNDVVKGRYEEIGETAIVDGEERILVRGGTTKMDLLNERVKDFTNAIKNDEKCSITCQTAYVTFSDDAKVYQDFLLAQNKETPVFKPTGDKTYIVKGLELALELIDKQKDYLRDEGIQYYQPWLIILTDGCAHDGDARIKSIKNELIKRQLDKKLTVYSMALSDGDELYNQIRGYSVHKPVPYGAKNFENFFTFLKKSMSQISAGRVNKEPQSYTGYDDIHNLR